MKFHTVLLVITSVLAAGISSHAQTVTSLYSFTGADSSQYPGRDAPTQGRDGKLYDTTLGPLDNNGGSFFALTTTGKETQPYTFGSDGAYVQAGVTLGSDGNFYGTAFYGGATNNGVLFKLTPTGVFTDLHDFAGGLDGANPGAPPIQASDSNYYGTTLGTNGASTIYRYESNGTFTTLYNLPTSQGKYVVVPLVEGSDGNLYGTASAGGNASSCGTIFKLSTSGEMLWTYDFPCGVGGSTPFGPLMQASDGNFYGVTYAGGNKDDGTVFKLDQSGNVSVLHQFEKTDGSEPEGGLTQGTDGYLYGTTSYDGPHYSGTIFQISTGGSFKTLYNFGFQGTDPLAGLMQHTNGTFYGTTYNGGRYGLGTVYSLDMGLGPFITFVQATGASGGTAEILGQGLTGTTSVTFNGVAAASFKVVTDTFMTAVVPSGATTGRVVVTTPGGALTSNVSFRIGE